MTAAWPIVPLANVLTERREVPAEGALASGEVRVVAKVGFNDGKIEMRDDGQTKTKMILIRPGDLLLSGINAAKGAIAVYDQGNTDPIAATIHYGAYIPNSEMVDVWYLWWLLRSQMFRDLLLEHVPGGIKTELRAKRLLPIPIPLPPVVEQRRIVARVKEISAKIEDARMLRLRATKEVDALLSAAEMSIWPEDRVVGAPQLADVTSYLSRGRQSKQGPSTHRLIKTRHVQMGVYVESTMTLDPVVADKVRLDAIARPGDVLIACSAAGCLGRVALYTDADVTASTDTHVAIARANPEVISSEYLYAYLLSAQGQYQLRSRERGDWTRAKITFRLTELNLSDLRAVPIPVPSPQKQQRIVSYVNGLRENVTGLRQLHSETAAELEALLPSVLNRAFNGTV